MNERSDRFTPERYKEAANRMVRVPNDGFEKIDGQLYLPLWKHLRALATVNLKLEKASARLRRQTALLSSQLAHSQKMRGKVQAYIVARRFDLERAAEQEPKLTVAEFVARDHARSRAWWKRKGGES